MTRIGPQLTPEGKTSVREAPMINLTEITAERRGTLLPVKSVGILPEPATPYVRTTDGAAYRLPADLYDWTDSLISHCIHRREPEPSPVLPAMIEFGIKDGKVYVGIVEEIKVIV